MRIYSMTATFGKLEHSTLTLQPGLNIIHAPNEWGKSTWCAFLITMLYGMDSKRAGSATLADKERYAPWSGAPMSGRIDLCWNGRDITIERRTKGRVLMGDFRAYETQTGMDVPELTGENCGQKLLGVERSVFVRSGFLKLTDMPVTQDDSLRRRLNSLVTTGDESDAGDRLGQTLKDLKNKCRYNQSGLLPQAENEREQLRKQLYQLQDLQKRQQQIHLRQQELTLLIDDLTNHQAGLAYAASVRDAQQVEAAELALTEARLVLEQLEQTTAGIDPVQAQSCLGQAKLLQSSWAQLQEQPLPEKPQPPQQTVIPVDQAQADAEKAAALAGKGRHSRLVCAAGFGLTGVGLLAAVILLILQSQLWFLPLVLSAAGILAAALGLNAKAKAAKTLHALTSLYTGQPETWVQQAQDGHQTQEAYQKAMEDYLTQSARQEAQREQLATQIRELTQGRSLDECCRQWEQTVEQHRALEDARRTHRQAQAHAQTLRQLVKPAQKPEREDPLSLSEAETQTQLTSAKEEQHRLQLELGQCLGQIEAIGQEPVLRSRLDTLNRRITRLEDTYYALEMAQEALRRASTDLQRRFAPRISRRAQQIMSSLTDGRYNRILMAEDLTLSASAENEDTVYTAQWRSDGTVDQLYLALRLAVAEELTPDAPLVLDDALVRFDDQRLAKAMAILKEQAQTKQVILFTCQGREVSL